MIGKSIRLATMLAAAFGIPYAWFNPQVTTTVEAKWAELKNSISSLGQTGNAFPAYGGQAFTPQTSIPTAAEADGPPLTGEARRLDEVLRFDVTPRWVMRHWGRVSTIHSESDVEGLRVPLVTGTDVTSVTGSLTYYFDKQQQVRRITLHGHTGDDRELVQLLTRHFGLRPESALGGGFYLSKWNGEPTSLLRVSHAPIIRANSPHAKLQVALELNQTQGGFRLSPSAQSMLHHDQLTNRW